MFLDPLLFAAPHSLLPALVALVLGLMIGSFLNVVIHRLPKMLVREFENDCAEHAGHEKLHTDTYNLAVPRSACPHCQHRIGAMENIPVVSYLMLGGKCKGCKAPISARYPIVETVAGLLSAWMVWHFGSGWEGLAALFFMYSLLAMTMIDLDTMYLPDNLTLPLLWVGLLININGMFVPLMDAVIGAAAGYMALWTVSFLYSLLRGHPGMGNGDFKLLGALGAWMGWSMLPAIILLSSIVGSVVGIGMIVFARHGREVPIPFGPYLAGAGLLALIYGQQLTAMGQRLLQG